MKGRAKNNEKGFTIIELIVVVAILAILGAVLVPMFSTMTAKARLSTDIITVKTLQRQFDIYKIDKGKYPDGYANNQPISSKIIQELVTEKYLDEKDVKTKDASSYEIKLQTVGAAIKINSEGRCTLSVVSTPETDKIIAGINNDKYNGNCGWVESAPSTIPTTTPN